MSKIYVLLAIVSFGAAYGVNERMAPELPHRYGRAELTMQSGSMEVKFEGKKYEIGLINTHFQAASVKNFDRQRRVRQLRLRSPQAADAPPSVEVFAAFDDPEGTNPMAAAPKLTLFRGVSFPVLEHGFGKNQPSYVDLDKDGVHERVLGGTITFDSIIPFESMDGAPTWRVIGRVQLQVESERAVSTAGGKIKLRALWD